MIFLEINDMDSMDRAGTSLARTGDAVAAEIGQTIRKIDGLGAPWGGDAPGQAFWGAYRGAATTAVVNASQIGAQVQTLGANTGTTLAVYRANEESAAAMSKQVMA